MNERRGKSQEKSAVWRSQCGGQGFDPPLLHQKIHHVAAAFGRLFLFPHDLRMGSTNYLERSDDVPELMTIFDNNVITILQTSLRFHLIDCQSLVEIITKKVKARHRDLAV